MPDVRYRDLPEYGLLFVTPSDAPFQSLVEGIAKFPLIGPEPPQTVETGAVLLNQSGKTIITQTHVWAYTNSDGRTFSTRRSDLVSSAQIDALTGEQDERNGILSFILPGSKRLITEAGVFGNNSDVLPPESMPSIRGFGGGHGSGGRGLDRGEIVEIQLTLDVAIFDDGLCVGPDSSGLFESLTLDLERRRETARQIVDELRRGASRSQIFEILRPLASRQRSGPDREEPHWRHNSILWFFATPAIDRLVNVSDQDLFAWFEKSASDPRVGLHRAG